MTAFVRDTRWQKAHADRPSTAGVASPTHLVRGFRRRQDGGINETSQTDDQTGLGPFAPEDEERFQANALVIPVAFVSLPLLGLLDFLLPF